VADGELSTAGAAGRAIRTATRVDRAGVSLRAGLIAAVPVAGGLVLGTAAGRPVAAVTIGVGAMLAGVAWRAGGPAQPPIATMVAAAGALSLATVAGTVTGTWPWLHLVLLAVFCLVAGLLSALGRRGAVVGTQSVIAFVVFGRFPQPLGPALVLVGLVALGAGLQIAFAKAVASPPAWRRQRGAVADAYERLAELARFPQRSSLAAATALDLAEAQLTAPALLGDPGVIALSDLVAEGRRLRLSVAVLSQTLGPTSGDPLARDQRARERVEATLGRVAAALAGIAATVRDRRLPVPLLSGNVAAWVAPAGGAGEEPFDPRSDALLAGLVGQIAAAARMASSARGRAAALPQVHPSLGSRLPFSSLPSDLRRLRASATLDSAAGRHAVRLAVVVAGTELLVQRVALPRGYWAVVAAATVLRPEFGATITRAAERVGGTCAGVVIATLIAVGLQPGGWGITAIVAMLAVFTFAIFPASFAAGTAGLSAMIVFLLHAVAPDSVEIAFARGLDTLIGGAIGLAAYVLWPTWSGTSVARLLANVADAQRRYLEVVLGGLVAGVALGEERLRPPARRARIAYSDAEAAVTLAQSEPLHGTDPGHAATVLSGLRRVVYAVHALRVEGRSLVPGPPRPELGRLEDGVGEALGLVAERLNQAPETALLPPLRRLFRDCIAQLDADARAVVEVPLDELVDATNTVAGAVGLPVSERSVASRAASETIA
jgi:uncharacterized membrane protein YccC